MSTLAIIIGMLVVMIFLGCWWYFATVKQLDTIRALLFAKGIALIAFLAIGVLGYAFFQ